MPIVTIGNFDGVHRGHQALLQAACAQVVKEGPKEDPKEDPAEKETAIAVFFDPHPSAVLFPDAKIERLTTSARRAELLRKYGIDRVYIVAFDRQLASQSARDFAEERLFGELKARTIVVGEDFRFGHQRAGDVALLRELAAARGAEVIAIPQVREGDAPISSTRIRDAIKAADLAQASRLLGRAFETEGRVIRGDQRGREIGFPTANLEVETLVPGDGVYAVFARVVDEEPARAARLMGVANVGVRPTFHAGRSVEVHLFGFEEALYGKLLRVAWVEKIRGEQKFEGVDALVAQIKDDAAFARQRLEALAFAEREGSLWSWI